MVMLMIMIKLLIQRERYDGVDDVDDVTTLATSIVVTL